MNEIDVKVFEPMDFSQMKAADVFLVWNELRKSRHPEDELSLRAAEERIWQCYEAGVISIFRLNGANKKTQ